ncbi:MAG: CarD family transcriptional regulator [Chloroflexota bacterium]
MGFPVGSTVIHARHGLGQIVQIEENLINGQKTACYVVTAGNMTIWVPIESEAGQCSLRMPASKSDFENLFKILRSPYEPLPEDRKERKTYLLAQLTDGSITSLCYLIRDLSGQGQKKKLSDDDRAILERAQNALLSEWTFSLSEPINVARKRMTELLQTH